MLSCSSRSFGAGPGAVRARARARAAADEPLTNAGLASGGIATTRAETFVWLADDALLGALYARCEALLQQTADGCRLVGVNARWRLYRYGPGALQATPALHPRRPAAFPVFRCRC